ncbi:acyl carrier protein [Hymenobacter sp. BT664]|uniref:Acyl carrier protein n=1 Tax=Hymenobacter montanus TaxID=2771359 RepID=A0A927GID1_9BACT|nr:acyl carrier protein [Hymenobacter montanus]MBD2766946.1 acyl carrier protein [Hymenobacter montanus]
MVHSLTRGTAAQAQAAVAQQVLRVIRQRKAIRPGRLRRHSSLSQELGFDTVDIVDIILELERRFSITIPDEVPLVHVDDFVRFVAAHAPAMRQAA